MLKESLVLVAKLWRGVHYHQENTSWKDVLGGLLRIFN